MTDRTNTDQEVATKAADENLTDAELDTVSGGFILGGLTTVGKFVKDVAVGAFEGGIDGLRAGYNGHTKR